MTLAVCTTLVIVGIKALETYQSIAAGLQGPFLESKIQETFQNTAFAASGNEGGILEVATADTTEIFAKKSEISLFDHILPLGATVSEIQIPAVYRYHIDLNDAWQISSQQNKCVVVAPKISASLPVAFDTGKMKSKTASGWARWNKHENLSELKKSLTGKLAKKAVSPKNIDRVREEARLSIAKFVKTWLLHQEHWNKERFTEIIILFPDEVESLDLKPGHPLPPATLRLNHTVSPPAPEALPETKL
ncbi:MAG: hypothetical protein GXP30_02945 [Verrucomicrobia bacterium]|nr:hypothetical protein [Verrucomicrobiota bacterium]